jgi:exosortase/archaeosortase
MTPAIRRAIRAKTIRTLTALTAAIAIVAAGDLVRDALVDDCIGEMR